MSFRLARCPSKFCRFECNYDDPIREFDPLKATTAVEHLNTCPLCGCPLVIYSPFKVREVTNKTLSTHR